MRCKHLQRAKRMVKLRRTRVEKREYILINRGWFENEGCGKSKGVLREGTRVLMKMRGVLNH